MSNRSTKRARMDASVSIDLTLEDVAKVPLPPSPRAAETHDKRANPQEQSPIRDIEAPQEESPSRCNKARPSSVPEPVDLVPSLPAVRAHEFLFLRNVPEIPEVM